MVFAEHEETLVNIKAEDAIEPVHWYAKTDSDNQTTPSLQRLDKSWSMADRGEEVDSASENCIMLTNDGIGEGKIMNNIPRRIRNPWSDGLILTQKDRTSCKRFTHDEICQRGDRIVAFQTNAAYRYPIDDFRHSFDFECPTAAA